MKSALALLALVGFGLSSVPVSANQQTTQVSISFTLPDDVPPVTYEQNSPREATLTRLDPDTTIYVQTAEPTSVTIEEQVPSNYQATAPNTFVQQNKTRALLLSPVVQELPLASSALTVRTDSPVTYTIVQAP